MNERTRRKWYEIDYRWYCPEDTVYRPTEIAAFEHLDLLAGLLCKSGFRVDLLDSEWLVLLKDIELRKKYINANVTPHLIAQHLHGYDAPSIEAVQRQISVIMALRAELSLSALPVMPMKFREFAKRIERKAA